MQNLKEKVKKLSKDFLNDAIEIRRHIHANPELGFNEFQTSEYISSKLTKYGIKHTEGIAKTGIVSIIEGKKPSSKVIALRADIDALPIEENSDASYKSKQAGVMHACGHDAHIASLLGTAWILSQLKDEFTGTVKMIFQPSEEKFPGGASVMIKEGVLENPHPEKMYAQHVLPGLESGKVGFKCGKYMASTDEIYITVRGVGGHAATPELITDPILIASHIIIALQQIVSRNATPSIPSVLSFGRVIANGRTNIIPDEVIIEGTFRTFNEEWRAKAHENIICIASNIAEGMGGNADVFIDKGYPFLVNEHETTSDAWNSAIDYLGKENVVELEMRMTAEDFAYFSQKVPSCYYRLGIKNEEKGINSNLHTNTFDIDESCLETGIGVMTWIALTELNKS